MKIKSQNDKNYYSENKINLNKSSNNNSQIHDSKNIHTSKNYFKLYKEIENSQNNSFKKQKNKNNPKMPPNSLNEKIYSNYSKKLGDYYHKNKEDLYLYGSKKYDLLAVDNLVEEMKQYKSTIIENIKQNQNKLKNKNYGLESNDDSLILTPLAEKERSRMGNNEKEQFNAAERFGVVMRRIEYTNLLSQNGTNASENDKVFFVMKDAVAKIEKCWLFYKNSRKRKLYRGMKLLEKYIKRKVLNFFDYLNNEKLKYIYMSHNPSMLSFKNDIDSSNTNNQKLKNNNNSNRNSSNYQNNTFKNSLNDDINNNINNNKENVICFIGYIKIDGEQKKSQKNLKKDYGKVILNYKMQKDELNKNNIENSNLINKINSLNKDIDILKKEKDDLIKNYESISANYNKLLKDYETLNQNYTNLLNNNQIKSNSSNKNTFSIRDNQEYISLLNENNNLNEEYNKLLEENKLIKNKCQELNNHINLQNNEQRKNDENISNQFTMLEEQIKEYKLKNESLNNELLKAKNDYDILINNLNAKIDQLTIEKNELQNSSNLNNINNNGNNDYINQIELLRNKINEYENKIKEYENKIKSYENKEINVYPKQINELKNKNENYEKQILFLKSQIEIIKKENIKIKNESELVSLNKDNNNINHENIINENNNLKKEINSYKSNLMNLNQNLEEYKLKIEETEEKLNTYIINNNKLLEENNNFKITCNKLNNLINGLNISIKKLLEENKNLKRNCLNISNAKKFNKLFILFIDTFLKKKLIEYKYMLIIKLQKDYIDNSSKYIIYQTNSVKNSLNLDGYEKVITGESKKVILQEDNKNKEISYDKRILIHQDLDDTLKDYITKGKDNFIFEEIFDGRNIKNNNIINSNNNIYK